MTLAIPPFRPHPLIRGGHAQTVLGAYLPHPARPEKTALHEVALPDGDVLIMHDDRPDTWRPGDRCALLVHGLGGSHASPYMLRLAVRLNEQGVRAFRLDLRGCGAGYALARLPCHAGRSDDAAAAAVEIARLAPNSPLSAIGFSLGGNVLLKLAGECCGAPPGNLDSVAGICPPIDLAHCAHNMRRISNRIYDKTFIRSLMAHVARRKRELPHLEDSATFRRLPRRLVEFDDVYTAPRSGFASAAEYYARSSSAPLLDKIEVSTLILSAADDPLIPPAMLRNARLGPDVHLHIAESGGHLGFVARRGTDPDRRWLDWRLVEWVMRQR